VSSAVGRNNISIVNSGGVKRVKLMDKVSARPSHMNPAIKDILVKSNRNASED
jgi:hypothetical protein